MSTLAKLRTSSGRLSSIAVVALVATLLTSANAGAVAGFGDVEDDEFYTEAVQWMSDTELTTGTSPGCFSPMAVTTRGQAVTFIHRTMGSPDGGAEPFADVSGKDYFAEAVAWMVAEGITTGTSPTTFEPHRPVTRGEFATFLHRANGTPSGGAEPFSDVNGSHFFAGSVAWMVSEGITTGTTPTTFEPYRSINRAELATFLYRQAGQPAVTVTPGGNCGGPAAAPAAASIPEELQIAEARSFDQLNQLRSSLGLAPLQRSTVMDTFARDWSQTMDEGGFFKHSGGPYGENIAWWSAGWGTPAEAADLMHDLWVNSPGHYANMTRAQYREIGVGFWRTDDGGWHATHVFR